MTEQSKCVIFIYSSHKLPKGEKVNKMPSKKSNSTTNAPHGYECKLHKLGIKTHGEVSDKYRADTDLIAARTEDHKNAAVPAFTSWVVDNTELFDTFVDQYWSSVSAKNRAEELNDILERYPELTIK